MKTFGARFLWPLLLALVLGVTPALAADAPDATKQKQRETLLKKAGDEESLLALCSGLKACLNVDYEGCLESDQKPLPKIKYDKEFCEPYKEISKRGFKPSAKTEMSVEIFSRLGKQYRAIYVNKGTLPLNENVIGYLFDNMPFTATLINTYLETNYTLTYPSSNHRYFNGSNGRSLTGEFYWALQDSAGYKLGLRNLFFGYGHAKILKWSLSGTAVAYLDMDPLPGNKLSYKLTAIVFPANTVLNSIMQMGVFKKVVNEKLDDIVSDVKKAAGMYFGGNLEPIKKSSVLKSKENVQYLQDFESVVKGKPWKLGDFDKLQKQRKSGN